MRVLMKHYANDKENPGDCDDIRGAKEALRELRASARRGTVRIYRARTMAEAEAISAAFASEGRVPVGVLRSECLTGKHPAGCTAGIMMKASE